MPIVATKKLAASTAVVRDKKLAAPLAPNRLPEAPPPNAAPMSAPLPCCSRISTMMATAQITWTTINNEFSHGIKHSPSYRSLRSPLPFSEADVKFLWDMRAEHFLAVQPAL